jgi:hypothetical protein
MAKNTPQFTLPDGLAVYPKTDQPYRFDQKLSKSVPDPDGAFELSVSIPKADAEAVVKQLKAFAKEEGLKAVKNWPFHDEVDRDTGEPTGRVIFKAKAYGKTKDGRAKSVRHYDGMGRPVPAGFKLTSGSLVSVRVWPSTYTTLGGGVKLSLEGVQVLKYVEFNDSPFKAREDAEFVAETGSQDYQVEDEGTDEDPTDF